MVRQIGLRIILTVLLLLATNPAWGQGVPTPVAKPSAHKPALAVTVSTQQVNGQNNESLEDLLMIEMANQSVLQIVDRQKLQAVLKEQATALSNVGNTQNAIALGKFVGADYLLHVLLGKKAATVRLVEVASGQVKLEGDVGLRDDLALSAAAIRERVLAALQPESQAANRLTVGIAAFPNRSGTDRSDKLGIELQKALRKRLQQRPWAVVLERQYPAALLEEVDLARLGLVRKNAVEKLPPADLVILGTLDDVGREYEPGKPWAVKLDLTLRLQGHSTQIQQACRSDAVEEAADLIAAKIDKFHKQPTSQAIIPEKELWRRQALYLMPRPMLSGYRNAIIPEFYSSNETNQREVIRAWENVLLLDDTNAEAMTYLGVCGIGFSRWYYNGVNITGAERSTKSAQWVAASRLLERALEIEPNKERAATYLYCLRPMVDAVPTRAKEMAQYVQSHPDRFAGIPESPWVKVALTRSPSTNENGRFSQLARVLANAENDPNAVLIAFPPGLTKGGPVKQYTALLNKYANSTDPVVQYVVHRALGEMSCWARKDPAALTHFDKAIAVMEAAYAKCESPHRDNLNNIYRLKIEACLAFNRPEEAKKTAWTGVNHFMKVGRFDSMDHFDATSSWFYENYIGWLYQYCVTEAIGDGQEKQALAVCDAYLAAAKPAWTLSAQWPRVSARREELLARLAGNRPPDMTGLHPVMCWQHDLMATISDAFVPMATLNETLWFIPGEWMPLYRYDGSRVVQVTSNPHDRFFCVAACQGAMFCSGREGLLKLDAAGNVLRRYNRQDASLPGSVGEVCVGDDKIYFSFRGSPCNGIAVFDPVTDKVAVLAPLRGKRPRPPSRPAAFPVFRGTLPDGGSSFMTTFTACMVLQY